MTSTRKASSRRVRIDLDDIALSEEEVAEATARTRCAHRAAYLRGPVSWEWLTRAAALPGKALFVGVLLHYWKGIVRSSTVSLNQTRLGFGIDEQAVRRAVHALEQACLIAVVRKPGRALRITVLDVERTEQAGET